MGRSLYASRLSTAAGAGLGGGYGVAGFTLSVLAGADCLFADSVAICFGDLQSFNGRITHQTLEAVPDPGRVFAASGVGRYR